MGLGGEGILRTYDRNKEAQLVIREALNQGLTYCDCARVYSDSERYYGEVWKNNPELRREIFQTSKSASRDRDGALTDLSASLQRLQTDYLDLWQIHDVRTEEDFAAISRPGGALDAFISAREKGLVKNIGVTNNWGRSKIKYERQVWVICLPAASSEYRSPGLWPGSS